MAEKENGEDPQVNLEMPSIGFGRKKRRKEQDTEPATEETVTERVQPVSDDTRPLYVDDVPATEAPVPEAMPAATPVPKPAQAPKPPREPRPPIVTGMVAAILTGAVIGGLTVALTYGGLRGCDAVLGSESCGGPGFFVLLAIMVLMIVTGGWLLKYFQVIDPGSTSFLAVSLAVVIALLFFIEVLTESYMVIVMPVIFVATYALSHWVTVRYIEPADHG